MTHEHVPLIFVPCMEHVDDAIKTPWEKKRPDRVRAAVCGMAADSHRVRLGGFCRHALRSLRAECGETCQHAEFLGSDWRQPATAARSLSGIYSACRDSSSSGCVVVDRNKLRLVSIAAWPPTDATGSRSCLPFKNHRNSSE